jgi:hypothetical protein
MNNEKLIISKKTLHKLYFEGLKNLNIDKINKDIGLKVTKLNNGVAIPEVTLAATWIGLGTPARCWYNNIPS